MAAMGITVTMPVARRSPRTQLLANQWSASRRSSALEGQKWASGRCGFEGFSRRWPCGTRVRLGTLFIGDAGITEASRPSRRLGLEWTNYARLNAWLTAEGDVSFSRARFTDEAMEGHIIPGSLDRVVSGALTVEPAKRVFGSIRLRHFGPRPLVEDASVGSESTTIWNGEIGYGVTNRTRLFSKSSTCWIQECRISTTSTLLGCQGNPWAAWMTSICTRRFRAQRAPRPHAADVVLTTIRLLKREAERS